MPWYFDAARLAYEAEEGRGVRDEDDRNVQWDVLFMSLPCSLQNLLEALCRNSSERDSKAGNHTVEPEYLFDMQFDSQGMINSQATERLASLAAVPKMKADGFASKMQGDWVSSSEVAVGWPNIDVRVTILIELCFMGPDLEAIADMLVDQCFQLGYPPIENGGNKF